MQRMSFYQLVANICKLGFNAYFKKIYYTGMENIPKDKPVILAANHCNGLLDPVTVGIYLPYEAHFITRGDVFTSFTAPIFARLKMMPIYRIRDGYDKLAKNEETFAKSYQLLQNNETIIIFSEGDCVCERQLRSLKKGTARMAFQALVEYDVDAYIVPVSVNYTHHTRFRGEVMIHCNEAFKTSEFKPILEQNKAKAIRAFNVKLKEGLKENVIHLDNLENSDLLNVLLEIERSQIPHSAIPFIDRKSKKRLTREKQLTDWLNAKEQESDFSSLREQTLTFAHELQQNGLTAQAISKKSRPFLFFLLLLVFPLFIIVTVANGFTYWLADTLTKKKIKQDIFVSTFRCFIMTFAYIPYWIILLIIGGWQLGWLGIGIVAILPFLAIWGLRYKDLLVSEWQKIKFSILKIRNTKTAASIENEYLNLLERLRASAYQK